MPRSAENRGQSFWEEGVSAEEFFEAPGCAFDHLRTRRFCSGRCLRRRRGDQAAWRRGTAAFGRAFFEAVPTGFKRQKISPIVTTSSADLPVSLQYACTNSTVLR